jgi:hypothetical protein
MADKTTINRAFNTLFFNFIDDISDIYPGQPDILYAKTSFEQIKRINPTIINKLWFSSVYVPYQTEINNGNIEFFFEKNYGNDLQHLANANEVGRVIDKIRDPIKNMNDVNKNHSVKYIQNLSKLALAYNNIK